MSDESSESSEEREITFSISDRALELVKGDMDTFECMAFYIPHKTFDEYLLALDYCLSHNLLDKAEYYLMNLTCSKEQLSNLLNDYYIDTDYSHEAMDLLWAYGAKTSKAGVKSAIKRFNTDQLTWYLSNGGQLETFSEKKWKKIILHAPEEFVRYLFSVNVDTTNLNMEDVYTLKESASELYNNTKVVTRALKRRKTDVLNID